MAWAGAMITGETPDSSKDSRLMASASWIVRRLKLPAPRLTPPLLLLPGVTTMRLVPRLSMLARICDLAP